MPSYVWRDGRMQLLSERTPSLKSNEERDDARRAEKRALAGYRALEDRGKLHHSAYTPAQIKRIWKAD